ncbi:MAG: FkbM family methyltransferase [Planctomycetes bacterium]|nr:FkbM family methyltransferase [Planctomycetota bacterium]
MNAMETNRGTATCDRAQPSALRRWYWDLCRNARRRRIQADIDAQLSRLRQLARSVPRRQAGVVELSGLRVEYDDALSLYMEYKHIFGWGIYDFRPQRSSPRVLDCGGHIGLSVLRTKQLAQDARITVFEPDERVLPLLHANLQSNGLRDVEVVPAALAAASGTAAFLGDGADGGALVMSNTPGGQAVKTVALSGYLAEPVEFLKMNIEGAELDVLREAEQTLSSVRQLVVEYHGFPQSGQVLHELLELLHNSGFRYALHHFDTETNPALRPPFRLSETTRFFQLVAATKVWSQKPARRKSEIAAGPHAPTNAADVPSPVSRAFGYDRGQPIDRHYIESFLLAHADHIRGRVLEIGEDTYTRRFGGAAVTRSDVLHIDRSANATIVADLTNCPQIADASFDCIILTQTLPFIFDVRSALANCRRMLRHGGCLLVTVPGISQRSTFDAQRWGDYWRFTPQSIARLLKEQFPSVAVQTFGNARSATALLEGRATHEISSIELEHRDPDYPVIIAAVATRVDIAGAAT